MAFTIRNHRLLEDGAPVAFQPTPNRSRGVRIRPEGVLVHDTAGRLDGDSSVHWLCDPAAKASAHLLVHRDGRVVQFAPFDARCWHAGRSSLDGRNGVNGFALGIEIVNPGRLEPVGGSRFRAAWGERFDAVTHNVVERETAEHGAGGWMDYTPEQLAAVEAVCVALFARYRLSWLWPHWKVSPGRKVDTNPLFPLAWLQSRLLGRAEDGDSSGVLLANSNQRRWPEIADNVIQVIPRGSRVEVVRATRSGSGDARAQWLLVRHGGEEGWVHGSLVAL